jgi:hypothetical protein
MRAAAVKPGDTVANKYTGLRLVVVEVRGTFARVSTDPDKYPARSVPRSLLRLVEPPTDKSPEVSE